MSNEYYPNKWVVIKIAEEDEVVHKVFASWSGGYLDGDSWRLNSGITKVEEEDDQFIFHGNTGSKYYCFKHWYGVNAYTHGVLYSMIEKTSDHVEVEILDQETDWLNLL